MQAPIVIVGIGELAGVFARGFLRGGHPVYPITREMDIATEQRNIPEPCLVLLAVPEEELHPLLQAMPTGWRGKLGLLQNELLPRDWLRHQILEPTVTVVWFEKKQAQALNNILYSPSYGPAAAIISAALQSQGVPAPVLDDADSLLYELLRKGLYILTVNICGLADNRPVGVLWRERQAWMRDIAQEVLGVQEYLVGRALPRESLISGMAAGIADCPERYCLGRRAPARLRRALDYAAEAGLSVPLLQGIWQQSRAVE